MLSIESIVKNSGDAVFEDYSYFRGILTLFINLTDIDMKVELTMSTEHLSFNHFYIQKTEALYKNCRIVVQELSNFISIENGVYIPAGKFGDLMKESRANHNLAYGKKALQYKYLFSLVGYDNLVSCLLSNLSCIAITEIKEVV